MYKIRIGWIADNFFPDVKRGAELEDQQLISCGEDRGHTIIRMGKLNKDVDLFIVANRVDKFNIGEILSYLSRKPYINLEHDLRSSLYPWYKTFVQEAMLNVFHSPLHMKMVEKNIGLLPKVYLHAMCLPPSYKDLGWERLPETEVLYVGDYAQEKGYKEMEQWLEQHPDYRIWHVGGGFEKHHPKMVEIGPLSQNYMPFVYNTFNSLIFIPRYLQACSRVIAEAYLCKVKKIITNGKDGFTSYGFLPQDYYSVRDMLIKGPEMFWNRVETEYNQWGKTT